MSYFFYLARCNDGSLYAGSSADPTKREQTHNAGRGAKYTRSRLPVRFVHIEECASKSEALQREALVKQWTKAEKEALVCQKCQTEQKATMNTTTVK